MIKDLQAIKIGETKRGIIIFEHTKKEYIGFFDDLLYAGVEIVEIIDSKLSRDNTFLLIADLKRSTRENLMIYNLRKFDDYAKNFTTNLRRYK